MKQELQKNKSTTDRWLALVMPAVLLVAASSGGPAWGLTRIRDVARPWGERINRLHGLGLVVGLSGTGDSPDSTLTKRPLEELLKNLGNPVRQEEMKSKNVALVEITAKIGRHGAREGDRIDVRVSSIGDAKSLRGGTLVMACLQSSCKYDDGLYALAQGPVRIPDPTNSTVGVVRGGADLEREIFYNFVQYDQQGQASFTLVIDESLASFEMARHLAWVIEAELSPPGEELLARSGGGVQREPKARVRDSRNVLVRIPAKQAEHAALFIARVLNFAVYLPEPEARVVINAEEGTISITGNVEIAPVIVCVGGMSIRIVEPEPIGLPNQPVTWQTSWARFDTEKTSGTKIDELIKALDQLNVPTRQKIDAIYAIERAGALRASLVTE